MIITIALGCLCGVLGIWAWHERNMHLYSRDAMRRAITESNKCIELVEESTACLKKVQDGLETNERLLVAQARVNDDLVREKNELWGLHQTMVAQLGNAQTMLLDEYQNILRSYNVYRAKHGDPPVHPTPVLEQVLNASENATLQ